MTLIRDEGGRSILEGTVHIAIAFDEVGNVIGCKSSIKELDVKSWGTRLCEINKDLNLPIPIVKYTMATYREMF